MSTSGGGRLFEIIALLRRSPSALALTDISRGIKVAPSSAHALLNVLREQGVVTIDRDKRYQLGPAIFYLGAAYARNTRIHRSIWRDLVDVAVDLQIGAAIAVPWQQHHLVLAVHQGRDPMPGIAVGGRIPLHAGSYGKVYYAWADAKLPTRLERYTPRTITSAAAYRREVALTRHRGYALDREEFVAGVGAAATAVTAADGYQGVAALMSTVSTMEERGLERTGERLASLGARASTVLGDRRREQLWEEQD